MIYDHHISHYKAVIGHTFLSCFFFHRGEIPTQSGYSMSRHISFIGLRILKKMDINELSKEWTLGILGSRFNHYNQVICRSAIKKCIDQDHSNRTIRKNW